MRRVDGRRAQAVIDPAKSGTQVLWFVNGQLLGIRHFDDWAPAIEWTDRLQAEYWSIGWRPSDEISESHPTRSGS
jgi:hypothetical protein